MFIVCLLIRIRAVKLHMIINTVQTWHTVTQLNQSKVWPRSRSAVLKAREFAYMRNQWSVSSHDGAMARYTVNTLLTSLIGLKERCVFCGEKPNKYIWQDILQSMRPLHSCCSALVACITLQWRHERSHLLLSTFASCHLLHARIVTALHRDCDVTQLHVVIFQLMQFVVRYIRYL